MDKYYATLDCHHIHITPIDARLSLRENDFISYLSAVIGLKY